MKAAGIDSRMFVYTYIYPSSTEIILDDSCVYSERIARKDPQKDFSTLSNCNPHYTSPDVSALFYCTSSFIAYRQAIPPTW